MAGIENLKNGLGSLIEFGIALEQALADNKIKFFEAIGLITNLIQLAPAIANFKQIEMEYRDIDEAEWTELYQYFVSKFDLENDRLEAIIEKAFEMLYSIEDFIATLKAGKK